MVCATLQEEEEEDDDDDDDDDDEGDPNSEGRESSFVARFTFIEKHLV